MSRVSPTSRPTNKAALYRACLVHTIPATENTEYLHTYGLLDIMFSQPGGLRTRKRGREGDDEFAQQSFQEHRTVKAHSQFPLQRTQTNLY